MGFDVLRFNGNHWLRFGLYVILLLEEKNCHNGWLLWGTKSTFARFRTVCILVHHVILSLSFLVFFERGLSGGGGETASNIAKAI